MNREDRAQRAFEKACRGEGLNAEESGALRESKGVFIEPTVQSVRREVAKGMEGSPEHREELQKIQRAVSRAVELNIVREETFKAEEPTERVCYLLSSLHYEMYDFDPQNTPIDVQTSQAQLFQFVHLLEKYGAANPMYVEERCYDMQYDNPIIQIMAERGVHIHDVQKQQEYFDHPERLIALMDEHQKIAKKKLNMSVPRFYSYARYPHFSGAHSCETAMQLSSFGDCWYKNWCPAFRKKYEAFQAEFVTENTIQMHIGSEHQVQIETGWEGDRPLLKLAGPMVLRR